MIYRFAFVGEGISGLAYLGGISRRRYGCAEFSYGFGFRCAVVVSHFQSDGVVADCVADRVLCLCRDNFDRNDFFSRFFGAFAGNENASKCQKHNQNNGKFSFHLFSPFIHRKVCVLWFNAS